MKTLIYLAKHTLIVACLFLASCSKDSSSSNSNPTPSGGTYFKLNGTLITPDEVDVTVYDNSIAGGRYIDVYAFKAGVQVLELHMPAAVGNYPAQHGSFAMNNSWLTYQTGGTDPVADYYHSDSGTMQLINFNESGQRLVGTFAFVGNNGADTKDITDGHLDISAF